MSDSGRWMGECKHGNAREVCSICKEIASLEDNLKRLEKLQAVCLEWAKNREEVGTANTDPLARFWDAKLFRAIRDNQIDWITIKALREAIDKAVGELDFEKAVELREQINKLKGGSTCL